MRTRLLASIGLVAGCAAAQTLTFAEGSAASLTIAAVPESNPLAPDTVVLQAVELLPIEMSGRTLAHEQDPTRSRRVERNGIARLELPDGGRLFRYRRAGGQFWGFLQIAADGAPRVVLEKPGVGGQLGDPFDDRIGVGEDGLHACVPLLAGGMLIVRLDGGTFASTGRADRLAVPGAIEVINRSVMVGANCVWFHTNNDEVMRCDFADGSAPVDVSPPLQTNAILKNEMAMARDGSRVVFLYGLHQQQRLWTVGATGTVSLLPPTASKYEEPGYLPEGPGEPAMLLDDDGSRLFYIDADVRDELWLLDMNGVLPSLQITENGIFQPYIGVHILPKFAVHELTVAIGDQAAMDWFRIQLAPGGGTVANLTGTGSLVQPFPAGTLDPVQAAATGSKILVSEQAATGLAVRRIDTATGAQALVTTNALTAPEVGSSTGAPADILLRGAVSDTLVLGSSAVPLLTLPDGLFLTAPVQGPQFAATFVHLAGNVGILAVYDHAGTLLTSGLETGIQQVCATASGGFVAIGATVAYFAPGYAAQLNRPNTPVRLCLSGAGG